MIRNGIRQPQDMNASSGSSWASAKTPLAPARPIATPICGQLPKKPRRWGGEYSTAMMAAPANSAPAPKPCASRIATSRIGARIPMWSYVGSRPMRVVLTPMTMSVVMRMALRPSRSPKCPNTAPPNGRTAKPTAYVAKAAKVPATGLAPGKNNGPNTSAAAVP